MKPPPPRIVVTGRGPELAGTRFTAHDIVPLWRKGHIPDYIAASFGLSREEVMALIEYIEAHKEEMLHHDDEIERRIARGNSPKVQAAMQEGHRKLMALREELRKKRQEANGESDSQ